MSGDARLDAYRAQVTDVFSANMLAISLDTKWKPKQRAGTAMTALSAAIGGAAGIWAEANPHIKNAPMEAVIADMMQLLFDVLTERKAPKLHVVKDGE